MLEPNNYFSINDITVTQSRAPCKFLTDLPKLGLLNPANEGDDLKTNTELELPIWLIQSLTKGQKPVVSTELPKCYKESYREILDADASAVDLNQISFQFYAVGNYVKYFDLQNKEAVKRTLLNTFKNRFLLLMDLAHNASCSVSAVAKLESLEKAIFKEAFKAKQQLNTWLVETGIPLEAAAMVINHKKRKRFEDVQV